MNKIKLRERKAVALASALIVVILLATLMTAAFFAVGTYSRNSLVQEGSDRALYCAQAGLEFAVRQIRSGAGINWQGTLDGDGNIIPQEVQAREDPNDPNSPMVDIGTYTVTRPMPPIQNGVWFHIPLNIVGSAPSLDGRESIRDLEVVIRAMNPGMNLFTLNGQLVVRAGADVQGSIFADRVKFNAPSSGTFSNVQGSVNYITHIEGYPHSRVSIEDGVNQIENVVFPGVNIDDFKAASSPAWHFNPGPGVPTEINLSALEGQTIPGRVIVVEGDANVSGHLSNHSLSIAATGNIYITGNVTTDNDSVQLGLFSQGVVAIPADLQQNLTIQAFVISKDGFNAIEDGTREANEFWIDFTGAVYAFGSNSTNQSIVNMGTFTAPAGLSAFKHNLEFITNNSIPQLVFFADIIEFAIAGDPGISPIAGGSGGGSGGGGGGGSGGGGNKP